MQHEPCPGRPTLGWIRLLAVVVDAQSGKLGHQVDEVEAAVVEASPDIRLGNVMAALADPGPDAFDVALHAVEARVPDANLRAAVGCRGKHLRDGARTERGLESEVEPFGDGALEQLSPLLPRHAVGFRLG